MVLTVSEALQHLLGEQAVLNYWEVVCWRMYGLIVEANQDEIIVRCP